MKIPELLAPAGDFESLEAAFSHGADAVYVGIENYNLRMHSPNFTVDELPGVIKYAHQKGRRIYSVLNTMPTDSQLLEIEELIIKLSESSDLPDAIIVSDPGVIRLCKRYIDSVELHLSTQTGAFNRGSLEFWASRGISRVILPRELNLDQVRALSGSGICETEIFIHGAMCVSISGRCLLGAYMKGRHANHGDCPQPCRLKYRIKPFADEENSSEVWFTAEEYENGVFLLNSKDLNTISILPDIIKTGVSSLKIEGRNKSVHYVSSVVKTYRAAIDKYRSDTANYTPEKEWIEELERIDHRNYTTGFYAGDYLMQETSTSKSKSGLRVVGIVKGVLEGGIPVVDVKNPFYKMENLNILPVNIKRKPYSTQFTNISDLSGNDLERAVTNRIVTVKAEEKLVRGDIIRRINKGK